MSFPRSCAAAVEAQHALNYFHPLLTKEVEEQAQEKKKKKKKEVDTHSTRTQRERELPNRGGERETEEELPHIDDVVRNDDGERCLQLIDSLLATSRNAIPWRRAN